MIITAISVKSESCDSYTFLMKSKRKPTHKQVEKLLESNNFYLDYDRPTQESLDCGEAEIGFIESQVSIKLEDL